MTSFLVPAFCAFRIFAVKLIVATPLALVLAEPIFLPFNLNETFLPAIALPFASLRMILYFPP